VEAELFEVGAEGVEGGFVGAEVAVLEAGEGFLPEALGLGQALGVGLGFGFGKAARGLP